MPVIKEVVIFLHFHSTKQELSLVDSLSHGLDKNQMYPDRDTLQHVIKAWWKVARQKAEKTLPGPASFLFRDRTQQPKHEASG